MDQWGGTTVKVSRSPGLGSIPTGQDIAVELAGLTSVCPPRSLLKNSQLFRPIAKGMIARSTTLLSIVKQPSPTSIVSVHRGFIAKPDCGDAGRDPEADESELPLSPVAEQRRGLSYPVAIPRNCFSRPMRRWIQLPVPYAFRPRRPGFVLFALKVTGRPSG